MPIYEYTCKQCDAKFEQLQRSMTNEAKVKCPTCGSSKTAREMSVFAAGSSSKPSSAQSSGGCGRCGGPGPCPPGYKKNTSPAMPIEKWSEQISIARLPSDQ